MSTNFYWMCEKPTVPVILANGKIITLVVHDEDPRVHIGRRDAQQFVWAQTPREVEEDCYHLKLTEKVIVDECGKEYTKGEFWEAIFGLKSNTSRIGQMFC